MSFRDRMNRRKGSLKQRHRAGTKKTGSRIPTIFDKDKVPPGIHFWRCKEGSHIVDIIPFEAGPDMPFMSDSNTPVSEEGDFDYVLDLFVHMNIGNMKKPFVCPYENFGKPCPICEYIKANRLEKDDWSALAPKHRVVYFVWVHDNREEEKKGLQIFEASHFFMEEKIEEIAKLPRGGGYKNFSDPDDGQSLSWKRKGSGKKDTSYIGHQFVDREVSIPDRILDKTFPLDSIVKMHPSYEEMKKELMGTLKHLELPYDGEDDDPIDDEDDVPFDDEDTNRRRRRPNERKPSRQRRKPSNGNGQDRRSSSSDESENQRRRSSNGNSQTRRRSSNGSNEKSPNQQRRKPSNGNSQTRRRSSNGNRTPRQRRR